MAIEIVRCAKCGTEFEDEKNIAVQQRKPCPNPKCGSTSRSFNKELSDGFTIKDKLGMKGKHAGEKKPFIEQVSGDDLFHETGEWRKLERVIDRENDLYKEIITNPKTGEVIRNCEEPLSKHTNRGTAKQKKDSPDTLSQ